MAINVSDVIDHAKFNRYHLRIVILCSLMVLFDGFDLGAISFAAPEFIRLFGINRALIGAVFSAGLFGFTLGGMIFGLAGDRWGVKRAFVFCGVLFGVFSLVTALARTLPALMAYRFLAGLALGGATPLSIALTSDFVPKRLRTSLVMLMYISIAVGQIVGGYTYAFLRVLGWRTVFYIGGLAPILLAPLFIAALPEPLEYLVMKGAEPARISNILSHLDPSLNLAGESGFAVRREDKVGFPLYQLFQDGRAARTVVLWVAFLTSLSAIFFFNTWLPTLLIGYRLTQPQIITITASIQLGGVFGTLVAAPIVFKLGGFQTITAGYLCSALAMVVLGKVGYSFGFLFAGALTVGFFLVGTQSALNASAADLYPPSMRATGIGWALGVGRVGSILSPSVAGLLVALHWQPSELFIIAAVPTLIASASAFLLLRLTQRVRV